LTFADTQVGVTSAVGTVVLRNMGDLGLTLAAPTVSGPFSAATNCSNSLGGGEECLVNITFTPPNYGPYSGTLAFATSAGNKLVQLSGTGLAADFRVTGTPANSITFPLTYAETTQATVLTLTVQNVGNVAGSMQLPPISGANPADFSATSDCAAIAAGQACSVTLSFKPQTEGAKSASFSLQNFTVNMSGSAYPAPTKGVNFAGMINGARILNPTNPSYYGPSPYSVNTDVNCANSSWYVSSLLCTNNTVGAQPYSQNAATTWSNSGGGWRYVVVDLGQTRQFNTAYVYQPNSDGRFTAVQLSVSDSPRTYADAAWVDIGPQLSVSDTNYAAQRMSLGAVSGRYVRVKVRHTGTVSTSWVEIRGLQLFYE
jgi:hypothetical protein